MYCYTELKLLISKCLHDLDIFHGIISCVKLVTFINNIFRAKLKKLSLKACNCLSNLYFKVMIRRFSNKLNRISQGIVQLHLSILIIICIKLSNCIYI